MTGQISRFKRLVWLGLAGVAVLIAGWVVLERWHPASQAGTTGAFALQLRWSTDLGEEIVSVAATDEPIAVVSSRNSTWGVDTGTGEILWRSPIGSSANPAAPRIYAGTVAIANDTRIAALDLQSGQALWSTAITTLGEAHILAVSECCVIVNRLSQDVTVYDRTYGSVKWVQPTSRGYVTAYVDGQDLLVLDQGVQAYDLETGKLLWRDGRSSIGHSTYCAGTLYFESAALIGYTVSTRDRRWSVPLIGKGLRKLIVAGDYVVVSGDDSLYALDAQRGALVWEAQTIKSADIVLLNDVIYAFDEFALKITAVDLISGEVLGALQLSGFDLFSSGYETMAATSDMLIIGQNHIVYGLEQPEATTRISDD